MENYTVSISYDVSIRGVITPQRREMTAFADSALTAIQEVVGRLQDELRMSDPQGFLVDVTIRCIVMD